MTLISDGDCFSFLSRGLGVHNCRTSGKKYFWAITIFNIDIHATTTPLKNIPLSVSLNVTKSRYKKRDAVMLLFLLN